MKKYFKVLATAVLVATMFGINKKDNSTLEDINISKVDFSNDCINMIREKEDPIHIRREGDEPLITTVKEKIVLKDTSVDKKDIEFRDKTFYRDDGIIGYHYEYSIVGSKIFKWEGAYSHFTKLCSKKVLESRAVSIEGDYKYSSKNYYQDSIYYSQEININLEQSLNSTLKLTDNFILGTAGFSNNFKFTENCKRKRDTNYYKEINESTEEKIHYELNSNAVKYCPDAYNIGLGLIGTFYTFDVKYTLYKNIFGDKNIEEGLFSCTIANESDLAIGYVYTKAANSEEFYYNRY